jgi:hypothetical protein
MRRLPSPEQSDSLIATQPIGIARNGLANGV